MSEIDEQEYKKLVIEVFNEDTDVLNAVDHWMLEGYSDTELLTLLRMAKLRAEKKVADYFEDMNRQKSHNDAADGWEHG